MRNLIADLAEKRIVVCSDDKNLAQVIGLILSQVLKLQIVQPVFEQPIQQGYQRGTDDCDLVLLALSSSFSEPVVVLGKSSLVDTIGRIPLLIISDRPFHADLDNRIFHLQFPFDIDDLLNWVEAILQEET